MQNVPYYILRSRLDITLHTVCYVMSKRERILKVPLSYQNLIKWYLEPY